MNIVCVPDRLVRDPATRRIVDDAGLTVDPNDLYWTRLLADGDVKEADKPEASRSEPAAKLAPAFDKPTSQEKSA